MIKLTIIKSDVIPDWYVLTREEHEHKEWDEEVKDEFTGTNIGRSYCNSCRIDPTDADVEGTRNQWEAIAEGISKRETVELARRCAVSFYGDYAYLYSPRNTREKTKFDLETLNYLANRIKEVLNTESN